MSDLKRFIKGLDICLKCIVNKVGTTKKGIHYIDLEDTESMFSIEEGANLISLGFTTDVRHKNRLLFKEKANKDLENIKIGGTCD